MKFLAIETATECCSVALFNENDIICESEVAPHRHNEIVLSMCERVLASAEVPLTQLDGIAFGRGPGAFTGVRLAASVTQGIALALDLPVVPVSSLAALAQAACSRHKVSQVLSSIDARMQEIYMAVYQRDEANFMRLVGEEQVIRPDLVNVEIQDGCMGYGSGWKPYAEILLERCGKNIDFDANAAPQAEFVAVLAKPCFEQGETVPATQALPVYVRHDVAQKPKSKTV